MKLIKLVLMFPTAIALMAIFMVVLSAENE